VTLLSKSGGPICSSASLTDSMCSTLVCRLPVESGPASTPALIAFTELTCTRLALPAEISERPTLLARSWQSLKRTYHR
jgi:hypothetical protein